MVLEVCEVMWGAVLEVWEVMWCRVGGGVEGEANTSIAKRPNLETSLNVRSALQICCCLRSMTKRLHNY